MRPSWLIGTLLLAIVAGCEEDPTGPGHSTAIDSPVLFDVREMYGRPWAQVPDSVSAPAKPRLALWLQTEKKYGCANFHIDTRWIRLGRTIRVELLQLSIDDICFTARGPAGGGFFLDLAPGDYSLVLAMNGETNTFHLSVTKTSVSASPLLAPFAK